MRSVNVIVVNEQRKSLANTQPTAHPRIMEAVDSHLERMKPFLDQVSVSIVNPTVQSQSREAGPIAELIDQKHSIFTIVFLDDSMKECSRRIGSVPFEQLRVKK